MFLGIIGGMGPNATIDFLQKLNDLTPIKKEQEHIPYLLISTPEIPDRSSTLLSGNNIEIEKIGKMLIKNVKLLENNCVSHIIITCNTAHYWEEDIKKSISKPFISIIEETCKYIKNKKYNDICILSTLATNKMGLYDKYLSKLNISFCYPNKNQQKKVSKAIYLIKKKKYKYSKKLLNKIIKQLKKKGHKYFIVACTELPIVLIGNNYIDPCKVIIDKINIINKKSVVLNLQNKLS